MKCQDSKTIIHVKHAPSSLALHTSSATTSENRLLDDRYQKALKASWLDTLLGHMLAIANDNAVYMLAFEDSKNIEKNIERLRRRTQAPIIPGKNKTIEFLKVELSAYFQGTLTSFTTPIHLHGTDFQTTAWQALSRIPYGETQSYADQAKTLGTPTAYRAIANANGANQIALLIPCHRVIASNGTVGGYAAGIHRKRWLLEHERRISRLR